MSTSVSIDLHSNEFRNKVLKNIDKMNGAYEKLEYLNSLFIKVRTTEQENIILDMLEQLKQYG